MPVPFQNLWPPNKWPPNLWLPKLNQLFSLVLPQTCPLCQSFVKGTGLCPNCWQELRPSVRPIVRLADARLPMQSCIAYARPA